MKPYFATDNFLLYLGDCGNILTNLKEVDMIFADPPYFLSNDGLTIQSGKIVSVNKGEWDKPNGLLHEFNHKWLTAAKEALKPNGTIWISGTMHNIFSVYETLKALNFKILNVITWRKLNPPPNFSCRTFTHSTEIILWARREPKVAHCFNYNLMRTLNNNKQMKDVWDLPSIARWEKAYGKHPTQKPLSVLSRIVLSSTLKDALIVDPFTGSSTTGIAATLFGRRFIGIDIESEYLDISINRYNEAILNKEKMIKKIYGIDYKTITKNEDIV